MQSLYGKNSFAEESKNLARYRSENIFVINQILEQMLRTKQLYRILKLVTRILQLFAVLLSTLKLLYKYL